MNGSMATMASMVGSEQVGDCNDGCTGSDLIVVIVGKNPSIS